MIELVAGVLVFLSTLFLCLSVEFVVRKLGRNNPSDRVRPTNVDVDLSGFDAPPQDMDLNLKVSEGKESSVLSESELIREIRALTATEVDFDFRKLEEAAGET